MRDARCLTLLAPILEVTVPGANVLTGYGPPEMLRWQEVHPLQPAAGQIRLRVRAAGVGPTDLEIRRGNLNEVYALARTRSSGSRQPVSSTRSATASIAASP
jgi:hypothetical protein